MVLHVIIDLRNTKASTSLAERLFSELQLFRLQMTDELSIGDVNMHGEGNARAN
jgi:hypothetical protein